MRIDKIYTTKKERRNSKAGLLIFLLFFLFFPYSLSTFTQNDKQNLKKEESYGKIWIEEKHFWGTRQIELEEYLSGMVAGTIPASFEKETLKAQAVILRSYCVFLAENKGGRKVVEGDKVRDYYFSKKDWMHGVKKEEEKYYERVEQAVKETEGKILLYQNEVIAPPFFYSGNGKTREISDYPGVGKQYPYLRPVACEQDMEAEYYSNYKEIDEKRFEEKIKKYFGKKELSPGKIILYRDSTDYVKVVEIDNRQMGGEEFRKLFDLESSCFSIEKINNKILFQTKGRGHGFGFSQFQANQLAKQGMTAEELLNYFFKEILLEKI